MGRRYKTNGLCLSYQTQPVALTCQTESVISQKSTFRLPHTVHGQYFGLRPGLKRPYRIKHAAHGINRQATSGSRRKPHAIFSQNNRHPVDHALYDTDI